MDILGDRGFRLEGVEWAATPTARWRGLMGRTPVPLLLATTSVHGFWLRSPLWLAGIARDSTVTEVRLLRRRRLVRVRGARWILELPVHVAPPLPGERLAFRAGDGEAGSDAGTSLRLRNPDRQSGRRVAPAGGDPRRRGGGVRGGHPT